MGNNDTISNNMWTGVLAKMKCFKCEQELESVGSDPFISGVYSGLVFQDTISFGSTVYDRLVTGIGVELIICDVCLVKYKDLTKEYRNER